MIMNRILMKCSAMLLALAAMTPAVSAGTIEFSYAVPTGLSLIRGTQQGTHILRQPSAKAPRLMLVDMGEGSYYKWSNDKREKGESLETLLFANWWLTTAVGKSGAYTKIDVYTDRPTTGYVLTSKTRAVKTLPFTIDEVKAHYSAIDSGSFAGMVVRVVEGEGVTCHIGHIEGDMIVFFKSMSICYDEDVKGVILDDDGYLRYGPDCASGESTYTCTPNFDASKMSPEQQARFFSFFQGNECGEQHVVFKTENGFEEIDNELPSGKKVNLKLEY